MRRNRPFDHYFGCMDLPGASSGVNKTLGPGCEITCGTAKYVCDPSPGYSIWGGKFAAGGQAAKYPYSKQSDANSCANGAKGSAAQMFSAQQIPVKATIAQEFGVFNKVRCLGLFLFSNSQSRPHRPAVLRRAGGVNAQPPVHAIGNQLRRCR